MLQVISWITKMVKPFSISVYNVKQQTKQQQPIRHSMLWTRLILSDSFSAFDLGNRLLRHNKDSAVTMNEMNEDQFQLNLT